MVTLEKSEKRKNHSNRVKITLKTSETHSKASENHSKTRVNFTFLGGLTEGQLETKSCPSVCFGPKVIHSFGVVFTLFEVIFTHFGMIFTRFESHFQSEWFLHFFILLKSNRFTLLH